MEYCIAAKEDKDEIIEFINKIFTEANGREIDFRSFYGKVYGDELKHTHHLIKENGRISAVLGVYQREYRIGDALLNTGFIGSVSVADSMRGKGCMKFLMQKAEADMRSKGISLAMLSGNRNRYGYFGYEKGGIKYEFSFEKKNILHTIGCNDNGILELIYVQNENRVSDELFNSYHNTRMYCCSRDEFFKRSASCNGKLYEIKNGSRHIGYVILSENDECINEIELKDWSLMLETIKSFLFLTGKEKIIVSALEWEKEKLGAMHKICETYLIKPVCSFKILDYAKALKALFELQLSFKTNLAEDMFTIGVKEKGCYRIEISNKTVTVSEKMPSDDSIYETADIVVDERDFVNAFMSPVSAIYEETAKRTYPVRWFPLGFAPAFADEF